MIFRFDSRHVMFCVVYKECEMPSEYQTNDRVDYRTVQRIYHELHIRNLLFIDWCGGDHNN